MKNLLLLFILIIPFNVFSQINQKDLKGDWYSTNYQFTHSDTIHFYKNQHHFINEDSCALIHWEIERKGINIKNLSNCEQDNYLQIPVYFAKYQLKKTDFGQSIIIKYTDNIFSKYK